MATEAIQAGADVERISRLLTWQEFEDIVQQSFESVGFLTRKHLVFTWQKRRFEVDLLATREPIVASVDCKHWRQNPDGKLRTAASRQLQRTRALQQYMATRLDWFGVQCWRRTHLVPVVIELADRGSDFVGGVPIVPILRLRSFLEGIDPFIPNLQVLDLVERKSP